MKTFATCAAVLSALAAAGPAMAAEPELSSMAEQLARLRSDLESLDARLEDQRESRRTSLRALAAQRAALELELQREALRAQQLGDRLTRSRDRQRTADARRGTLTAAMSPTITTLAEGVRRGLPFRVDERVAALEALAGELSNDAVTPGDALGKLWSWVDAEVALARTTGVQPQVIKLGDAEVMADVARIGLVIAYARTADGAVAVARQDGGVWSWSLITTPVEQDQVRALYAALEKDGDKGFLVLPRPISVVARGGER